MEMTYIGITAFLLAVLAIALLPWLNAVDKRLTRLEALVCSIGERVVAPVGVSAHVWPPFQLGDFVGTYPGCTCPSGGYQTTWSDESISRRRHGAGTIIRECPSEKDKPMRYEVDYGAWIENEPPTAWYDAHELRLISRNK